MKAANYLEQLQGDFEAQGLGSTQWRNEPTSLQWTHLGWQELPTAKPSKITLNSILLLTTTAGDETHREGAARNPLVSTELGELMLRYAKGRDSIPFGHAIGFAGCNAAEAYLVDAIDPSSVADDRHVSPVVVVKNDVPVSIIKGFLERTSYGIGTDMTNRIMEGAFSVPPQDVRARMRKSDKPYYIDIDEHGPAEQLLRVGAFMVPASIRSQLHGETEGNETSSPVETHEQIVQRVYELLEDAEHLPPADNESIETSHKNQRTVWEQYL